MQTNIVTTPFGRRSVTLAQIKGQMLSREIPADKSVDKWKIYRDICEAREALGLRDRALAVLNALLSFYPDAELTSSEKLIVFPSNAQLANRANGIAGSTLRENLAVLVTAGIIHRRDSPNGKRYARKSRDGAINDAFGFSLAPLLARSEEFAQLAQAAAAERHRMKLAKEQITLCRRDIRKLISSAIEEAVPGPWDYAEAQLVGLIASAGKAKTEEAVAGLAAEMNNLRDEVLNILESHVFSKESSTNGAEIRHHIQNSNTESLRELEPSSGEEHGEKPVISSEVSVRRDVVKSFPLGLVLRACPQILDYGPGGTISNWRDLMGAAVVVRSMLGVSPSAYQDACETMGAENAATAMACILERAGHINSAGGYLRDLTRKAARGDFSLGPMLMALAKAAGPTTASRAG